MTTNDTQTKAVLISERIFDVPREAVWRAWTEPELFMRWWGPSHFTSPSCQMDVRPGGRYLWCMRDPEGRDYYSTGVFHEVVPFERLVYEDNFADAQGNVISPAEYGMGDDFPQTSIITVTFEDLGGRTRLRVLTDTEVLGEMGEMASAGWNQSLDKLAGSLTPSGGKEMQLVIDREALIITITRAFDASPALVWRALTEPDLLARWWGLERNTARVDQHDLRPGGAWRIVEHSPEGEDHGFHGVFREVEAPRRLVQTFEYEPWAGHVIVETMTLSERPGGALLTVVEQFDSLEDLEGMVQSGMEGGADESYLRLARLLHALGN